jgi:threonine dehydratase
VAFASDLLGIKPTIVMPEKTPEIKIIQTRLYGEPDIILSGKNLYEAGERSREIQKEKGFIYIHPYDDDAIISGQGTVGLEILEQWPDVDTIIVPVGGGGLIAGITVAALTHHKDIKIIGVQSENADAATLSMEKGKRVSRTDTQTIADGINVSEIGERPFEVLEKYEIKIIRVTETQICSAIAAISQTAKLVVEPAGAVSAAAMMFHQDLFAESNNIVCVLSGANINMCCFANVLSSDPPIEP